jgi:hypothetical protein
MRLRVWAAVGGALAAGGYAWVWYYALVIYQFAKCSGYSGCPTMPPLQAEPWVWVGLSITGVGIAILVVTLVRWLQARRPIREILRREASGR